MGDITCAIELVELASANGWIWAIAIVLLLSLLGLTAFCMWCLWRDGQDEQPRCWVVENEDGTIWIRCDKTFKGTVHGVDGENNVIYTEDE